MAYLENIFFGQNYVMKILFSVVIVFCKGVDIKNLNADST